MKHFSLFNQATTLLVVSTYPDSKTGIEGLDAVAWHSHKTLHSLASKSQKVVIFAQKTENDTKPILDSSNILVTRTWEKGKPFSLVNTLVQILKFSQAKTVLFQFEFNIFGGVTPILLIPFLILILKIFGKNVIFEMHQVVVNIKQLQTHLNLKNPIFQKIFNLGLKFFYLSIGFLADNIVILEEELKHRLSQFVPSSKITFIPISVIKQKPLSSKTAKKILGYKPNDFVVMSFGYINWYKGSDWLVKAFSSVNKKNIKLLLAGGESPTLKTKKYYQNYYSDLQNQADSNSNVTLTGFVPDNKVSLYFSAADLIILPYRIFMSSSGPLSLAFSYNKPVLFSAPLFKNYINSPDIQKSLVDCHLKNQDINFPLNLHSFQSNLIKAQNNFKKLTLFSSRMAKSRNQQTVSQKYLNLINSGKINYVSKQVGLSPAY